MKKLIFFISVSMLVGVTASAKEMVEGRDLFGDTCRMSLDGNIVSVTMIKLSDMSRKQLWIRSISRAFNIPTSSRNEWHTLKFDIQDEKEQTVSYKQGEKKERNFLSIITGSKSEFVSLIAVKPHDKTKPTGWITLQDGKVLQFSTSHDPELQYQGMRLLGTKSSTGTGNIFNSCVAGQTFYNQTRESL